MTNAPEGVPRTGVAAEAGATAAGTAAESAAQAAVTGGATGGAAGEGRSAGAGGSVTVRMPSQLRSLTGGASEVVVSAGSVREVIAALEGAHPGVAARLLDEKGSLRRFVNIFIAEEDVRFLEGLDTPVGDGQAVSIIPAVAGG